MAKGFQGEPGKPTLKDRWTVPRPKTTPQGPKTTSALRERAGSQKDGRSQTGHFPRPLRMSLPHPCFHLVSRTGHEVAELNSPSEVGAASGPGQTAAG